MTVAEQNFTTDADAYPSDALAPGTRLLNGQYTIDRYLASGGFGITYLARDSLDRVVVIKECFPEAICTRSKKTVIARSRAHLSEYQSLVEMFVREARSIAKLDHPNIVGVHQVFEDNETAYMALDHIEGRDLLDTIESGPLQMSPSEVKSLLLRILDAITTVHDQDMLHRDISPDNILIDRQGAPVLIDFGAAREEASKKSRALSALLVVKDGYSPQEFYIAGSQQTACSDLYALAATFCHLITGVAPPNSQSRLAAIANHQPDPYQPMVGRIDGYEKEFLEALDDGMQVFPTDRIQTAHDWIIRIDADRRRDAALAAANDDQQIELTVMELVTKAATLPEEQPAPKRKPELVAEKPAPKPLLALVEVEPVLEPEQDDPLAEIELAAPPEDVVVEPPQEEQIEPQGHSADLIAPEQTVELKPEPAVEEEMDGGVSTPRFLAVMVIFWSVVVAMFDGWPAQLGYAAEPVLRHVFSLAPP